MNNLDKMNLTPLGNQELIENNGGGLIFFAFVAGVVVGYLEEEAEKKEAEIKANNTNCC